MHSSKISVCLTTYNGADFIERQLLSIAPQLQATDEIIITDDNSTDNTLEIIEALAIPQVKLFKNTEQLGYVQNFAKAIALATGDYIFLSDQDDAWLPNKVATVLQAFTDGATLVCHDAHVVDGQFQRVADSWWEYAHLNPQQGYFGNFYLNAFSGCMMAFKASLKDDLLPIPKTIEMHDQWLYLVNKVKHKSHTVITEPLMDYTRHGNNVSGTSKRSLIQILSGRLHAFTALIQFSINYKFKK